LAVLGCYSAFECCKHRLSKIPTAHGPESLFPEGFQAPPSQEAFDLGGSVDAIFQDVDEGGGVGSVHLFGPWGCEYFAANAQRRAKKAGGESSQGGAFAPSVFIYFAGRARAPAGEA